MLVIYLFFLTRNIHGKEILTDTHQELQAYDASTESTRVGNGEIPPSVDPDDPVEVQMRQLNDTTTTYPSEILGSWAILVNDQAGEIQFRLNGQSLDATLLLETRKLDYIDTFDPTERLAKVINVQTEALTSLTFLQMRSWLSWEISFYRPDASQWFYGVSDLGMTRIHGHFEDPNFDYTFSFDAVKKDSGQMDNNPAPLFGKWAILSNGYPGQLELRPGGYGIFSGQIIYDKNPLPNGSVPDISDRLETVNLLPRWGTWYIYFYRSYPHQRYYAIVGKDGLSMHGHFTQEAILSPFTFDGTRGLEFGFKPPRLSQTAKNRQFLRLWTVLAHRDFGVLSTTENEKTGIFLGSIAFASPLRVDENLKFTFVEKYNAIYTFFQSSSGECYYGLMRADCYSIHGHFAISIGSGSSGSSLKTRSFNAM